NGDRLPGRAVAIANDKLLFRAELGREQDVTIPLTAVAAVWLTPRAAARAAEPEGRRLAAQQRPQDVVLLTNQDALRGTVTALAEVAALNTYQGKAVYLSDLKPRRYEHTPYLSVRWPLAADRAVTGADLRLGGGTYDKGVGLHSRSRATFDLPRGAVRFEALV